MLHSSAICAMNDAADWKTWKGTQTGAMFGWVEADTRNFVCCCSVSSGIRAVSAGVILERWVIVESVFGVPEYSTRFTFLDASCRLTGPCLLMVLLAVSLIELNGLMALASASPSRDGEASRSSGALLFPSWLLFSPTLDDKLPASPLVRTRLEEDTVLAGASLGV